MANTKKIKIGVHGSCGKMGTILCTLIKQECNLELCYTYSINEKYKTLKKLCTVCDVIIDFSSAEGAITLAKFASNYKVKLVICSTGLSCDQINEISLLAKKIPILYTANTSLGANITIKTAKYIANILKNYDVDVNILEKHHNQKKDIPSGTALAIAAQIQKLNTNSQIQTSTSDASKKQPTITISSMRAGNNPGEHEIIFSLKDEVIKLTHIAYSKEIFAKGAIEAAKWIYNTTKSELYSMQDVEKVDVMEE